MIRPAGIHSFTHSFSHHFSQQSPHTPRREWEVSHLKKFRQLHTKHTQTDSERLEDLTQRDGKIGFLGTLVLQRTKPAAQNVTRVVVAVVVTGQLALEHARNGPLFVSGRSSPQTAPWQTERLSYRGWSPLGSLPRPSSTFPFQSMRCVTAMFCLRHARLLLLCTWCKSHPFPRMDCLRRSCPFDFRS